MQLIYRGVTYSYNPPEVEINYPQPQGTATHQGLFLGCLK
jgi:hypothetical protein